MDHSVKLAVFVIFCLVILHVGVVTAKPHAPFYPEPLIVKLGIDVKDIIKNQEKFRKDPTHTEWMHHVHSTLSDIDPDKEEAMIKMHTSLLYIKDWLDKAYFSGRTNKQEFTTRLTELMQWFQEANHSVLNDKQFNTLFGISGQDDESALAHVPDGEIGFPIHNPGTTVEMIKKRFDDRTIADITRFYRQRSQELRDVREIYETKDFGGATKWQVRKDMVRIEKELEAAFMSYCRDILSDEQFKLLFGSQRDE